MSEYQLETTDDMGLLGEVSLCIDGYLSGIDHVETQITKVEALIFGEWRDITKFISQEKMQGLETEFEETYIADFGRNSPTPKWSKRHG